MFISPFKSKTKTKTMLSQSSFNFYVVCFCFQNIRFKNSAWNNLLCKKYALKIAMKFQIAHISGNWSRVALDFQKLFVARYNGDAIIHLHDPTVPTYSADMEAALTSMIEMGKQVKYLGIDVAAIACNTMHLHKQRFEDSTGFSLSFLICFKF